MFGNMRSVPLICFILLSLQLCFESGHTLSPTSEDHLEAVEGERVNPVTSYYRHNIYGLNSYAFGFEVNDKTTGNIQFRDEKRYSNGSVEGSYGYVRPDGSVSITHFTADPEEGYLSQTHNFPPGQEAKWLESWPTKKPNVFVEKPAESITPQVTYNDKDKLNLTSILLPVEAIKLQHGIDLNPPTLEKELVNPAVLEVINGEAPLLRDNNKKKDQDLSFATVNEFIPSQFPIAPFELPQDENIITSSNPEDNDKFNSENKTKAKSASNKYNVQKLNNSEKVLNAPDLLSHPAVKSKENNAEKSMPVKMLSTSTDSTISKGDNKFTLNAKSLPIEDNDWYERIINQERQKYLRGLR